MLLSGWLSSQLKITVKNYQDVSVNHKGKIVFIQSYNFSQASIWKLCDPKSYPENFLSESPGFESEIERELSGDK